MPATATTPSTKSRREHELQHAAAAIIDYGSGGSAVMAQGTFLAWCAMPAADGGLAAVAHALYYLPQNFMIMLPRAIGAKLTAMVGGASIVNRIRFYDTEGSSHGEPSLLADAVIADDASIATDGRAPIVVVEPGYPGLAASGRGYTVGRNPEAIASALLKISRA